MHCKACGSRTEFFDTAEILRKYKIDYFRCNSCGLIQTQEPFWLAEAYSSAITDSDIGLVRRNVDLARQTQYLVNIFFRDGKRFVDYGGGYGMFVRLMRDAGFNFFRYDKYCANLFAKGFDAALGGDGGFDLLTAFELFEHLVNPVDEIASMLCLSRNIFFSTCLVPKENPPKASEWWYYVLQTGQHVTLYTKESLSILAEHNGLFLNSVGSAHLFSEQQIPKWVFKLMFKSRVRRLAGFAQSSRPSLLGDDYYRLTGQVIA